MTTITLQAYEAIRAAKHRDQWGTDAARRYCLNNGVHPSLYRLAVQLETLTKFQNSTINT